MLEEFCGATSAYKFNQDDVSNLKTLLANIFKRTSFLFSVQDIDFEGFQKFLDLFLDCDTPKELCKHLFLSFLRPYQSQITGNVTLSCMAAISSNTACAAVTSHNTRGILFVDS